MRVPEQYRVTDGPLGTKKSQGNYGQFMLPIGDGPVHLQCIASDGAGWEHVSVTVVQRQLVDLATSAVAWVPVTRCPTWDEMCLVRNLFWSQLVTVLQFHPPAKQYVNRHEFCLHLWRQPGVHVPTPPMELVG